MTVTSAALFVRDFRFAVWQFSGFNSPALDPRLDEMPPTLNGRLQVPIGAPEDVEQIGEFYFRQQITATDLVKMSAQDALERVPVEVIRARTWADVPLPVANPYNRIDYRSLRGTVDTISYGGRSSTTIPLPAEPPMPP